MPKQYSIITAACLVRGRPVSAAVFERCAREKGQNEFAGTELAVTIPPVHLVIDEFASPLLPPPRRRTPGRA